MVASLARAGVPRDDEHPRADQHSDDNGGYDVDEPPRHDHHTDHHFDDHHAQHAGDHEHACNHAQHSRYYFYGTGGAGLGNGNGNGNGGAGFPTLAGQASPPPAAATQAMDND